MLLIVRRPRGGIVDRQDDGGEGGLQRRYSLGPVAIVVRACVGHQRGGALGPGRPWCAAQRPGDEATRPILGRARGLVLSHPFLGRLHALLRPSLLPLLPVPASPHCLQPACIPFFSPLHARRPRPVHPPAAGSVFLWTCHLLPATCEPPNPTDTPVKWAKSASPSPPSSAANLSLGSKLAFFSFRLVSKSYLRSSCSGSSAAPTSEYNSIVRISHDTGHQTGDTRGNAEGRR